MRTINHEHDLGEILTSFPVRLTVYGVIAFALFQIVYLLGQQYGPDIIGKENGPCEMAQVYLAIFASGCLFYAATRLRRGRAGLITCAAMVGYAAARESDSILESLLFEDSYKYLIGLPLFLLAVAALWIDRRRVVSDAIWLVRQPAITMFAMGGIYLCAVCQVFDRPSMWSNISSVDEAMTTKAMVEEFAELFAYVLLAFSGVESLALAHDLDRIATSDTTEAPTESVATSDEEVIKPRIAA